MVFTMCAGPAVKLHEKPLRGHRKLRVEVVAVTVSAEMIGMGSIVVGNGGQGAEQYLAVGAGAFALDEQDEAIKLILDSFASG